MRLVAFMPIVKGATKDAGLLRKFVATLLYKLMIPGKFFFLPVLPKTFNRKIDRRAPEQMAASGLDVQKFLATEVSDPIEASLLEIWRRLPGFESVGTGDSFFDYGGHSLLAVRMIKETGREIWLRAASRHAFPKLRRSKVLASRSEDRREQNAALVSAGADPRRRLASAFCSACTASEAMCSTSSASAYGSIPRSPSTVFRPQESIEGKPLTDH